MKTWNCHICKKERPDSKISVRTSDISEQKNLPKGIMFMNVRYCNDNKICTEKSKEFNFFSGEPKL